MPISVESSVKTLEEQERVADMLQAFTTADQVIATAFGWDSRIQIMLPKLCVSGGGIFK
jgi:hypothetical protein